MKRRTGLVAIALALLAVGSAGAAPDLASFQVQPYEPRKAAPAFSLPSIDGRTVRLEDFRGKVVLLFFWAHWCGDCKASVEAVARISREFPKLAIVGPTQPYGYIAGGEEVPRAREVAYIEETRAKYYAGIERMSVPVSEENFKLWGGSTTPTFAVIDATGVVKLYRPGRITYDELLPYVRD